MLVPEHIAIIMDGNRRWAEKHGQLIIKGHRAGADTVRRVVDYCQTYGVKYLTLYAFSTENWNRPKLEVKGLMSILSFFLDKYIDEMNSKGVKLSAIGRIDKLPKQQQKILYHAIKKTEKNKDWNLILAISYGGRAEIADAVVKMVSEIEAGKLKSSDINEDTLRRFLYYPELPDPDLLIRTSGEMRLSNFLLWQTSYSEIYFTDVLWPDFSEAEFEKAIKHYSQRERRFGKR
jgi:undecaprenyl diphosphate synthase